MTHDDDVARANKPTVCYCRAPCDTPPYDGRPSSDKGDTLSTMDTIRLYRLAVFFAFGLSLIVVMEAFDRALLPNFYAQPSFQLRYGQCDGEGKCQLPAAWQSALSSGNPIGAVVGLLGVGYLTDMVGYRKTILVSLVILTAILFLPFFFSPFYAMLVAQVLQGIPWGIHASIAVAYVSDLCPASLRPMLTTYVNLCWAVGNMLAIAVLRAMVVRMDQWAYKVPYILQWAWVPPITLVVLLAPESPAYLVRKGRLEEAERALTTLSGKSASPDHTQDMLTSLKLAVEADDAASEDATYADLFRGINLRRTEIAVGAVAVQCLTGSALMIISTYFLEQVGLPPHHAYSMSFGLYTLGAIGTATSWFVGKRMGRRTMYLVGQTIMIFIMLAIGVNFIAGGSEWAAGPLLLCFAGVYEALIGTTCHELMAEVPSRRLRAKSAKLSRLTYQLCSIAINVLNPQMLNPTAAWKLSATTGFVWASSGAVLLVWSFFRLPELKGRSSDELDALFAAKVPAYKFHHTIVDRFGVLPASNAALAVRKAYEEDPTVIAIAVKEDESLELATRA